ncbi:MAG: helix-turn-helix domain-containing protein [Planctomycetes bacterium]|nr:helix-turn-helix domain-containing protein [Planctomycetota bacterium]
MKEKRGSRGLSLREASRLSGVSHTHIRDIEDGRSIPSFAMVMRFLKAYTVDMQDFLRETGYLPASIEPAHMDEVKSVPVISWTQAGNWQEICDTSQEDDYEEYVKTDTKGTFALRVRGDSMEPEFHDGDIIVINPFLKQEHNDYIVVCNEEGEATFKQLKKYGKTRVLHPLNPKYDDIELSKDIEYLIVGVVSEKKKRYR